MVEFLRLNAHPIDLVTCGYEAEFMAMDSREMLINPQAIQMIDQTSSTYKGQDGKEIEGYAVWINAELPAPQLLVPIRQTSKRGRIFHSLFPEEEQK